MNQTIRMKELPESERPYEKLEQLGAAYLSDAELLAVIIKNGCRGYNSVQLANLILNKDEIHPNLTGLMYLTVEQLMEIPGIGRVKAIQLQAIAELSKRIARSQMQEGLCFENPSAIANYYSNELRFETQECVYAIFMDQKCKCIKQRLMTKGTVNTSLISPRDIYIEALKCNAVQYVLVHNHPSGNVMPSEADRVITKNLYELGTVLQLPLIDHIIVGDRSYYSFAEANWK